MTPIDLDALEKALADATPGPAEAMPEDTRHIFNAADASGYRPWRVVASGYVVARCDTQDGPRPEADAKLYALLRNTASALLAELRSLRAAEGEAEERGARWALCLKDECSHCEVQAARICSSRRSSKEEGKR